MWPPRLAGLLDRAKDAVGQFRGTPDTVSLTKYARVLMESEGIADEFHLALIAQMGFGQLVMDFYLPADAKRFASDHLEKLVDISRRRLLSAERVLLILRNPPVRFAAGEESFVPSSYEPSPCHDWLPSAQHAVFPIYEGPWLYYDPALRSSLTLILVDGPGDFDYEAVMGRSDEATYPTPLPPFPYVRTVRILTKGDVDHRNFPGGRMSSVATQSIPEIVDPAGLDDAIAQASRLFRVNPPPAPPSTGFRAPQNPKGPPT
jgi:hypothetical protein